MTITLVVVSVSFFVKVLSLQTFNSDMSWLVERHTLLIYYLHS
jgi:hypothetical protein